VQSTPSHLDRGRIFARRCYRLSLRRGANSDQILAFLEELVAVQITMGVTLLEGGQRLFARAAVAAFPDGRDGSAELPQMPDEQDERRRQNENEGKSVPLGRVAGPARGPAIARAVIRSG
jgi:hypothetical protein